MSKLTACMQDPIGRCDDDDDDDDDVMPSHCVTLESLIVERLR